MSFNIKKGNSEVKGDFKNLNKLAKELSKKYYVDVGIIGAGSYEDGATIAGIGAVHEFGSYTLGIPERSFIRMPIEKQTSQIEKDTKSESKDLLGKGDIKGVFQILGIACENAIQEAFETGGFGTWPDITDVTKQKKGSSAILIDDGTLRKSITSKVGGGK
jgi:hypothetical protein